MPHCQLCYSIIRVVWKSASSIKVRLQSKYVTTTKMHKFLLQTYESLHYRDTNAYKKISTRVGTKVDTLKSTETSWV